MVRVYSSQALGESAGLQAPLLYSVAAVAKDREKPEQLAV